MRLSTLRSPLLALAVTSFVFANEETPSAPSDVQKLTANNFDDLVNNSPLMLVEFFAPWCGHCKALAPHYEEAATALKEKNISLASVDCVAEADLCLAKDVQGYPTLKVYRNGDPSEYTGQRKSDGIISYMLKQSLPAVSEVTSDNHEEFKKTDKLVVVAYLSSATQSPAAQFSATAEKHRDDYLFGLVTDESVIKDAGVEAPAVLVYRSYDEPRSVYPYPLPSATVQDFEDWLQELAIPILDEVSGDNYATYASSSKPLAYLFIDPTSERKEEHLAMLKPTAAKYKSKMNFVWIDAIKFGDHGKALNLQESKWPAFVIQNVEQQLKYPYDQSQEVSFEGVSDWVEKYLDGKLEPSLKSQPIPTEQTEAVYTLVGKSFEDVVYDDAKDVFVEFYASWCGHCKRLAPIWESFAEKYADRKDRLVIAKMEAQENDLPASVPFRVSGFPTLKFKPAGSRSFIDYEGDRSLESLITFVEEHAKNSLEPPKHSEQAPLGGGSENSTTGGIHDEL